MCNQKLILIIVIVPLLIGCATANYKFTNEAKHQLDYQKQKQTYSKVNFGISRLEEIPSEYWSNKEFVSVLTVMEKEIYAKKAGSNYRARPFMGFLINPLILGFPIYKMASTIADQSASPEFHKNINTTASNSRWIKEEVFFELLKQRLIFPSPVQPSFKLITYDASKKQEVKWKPEIESDAYVSISVVVFMQADPNFVGAEPKAKMIVNTGISVVSKEEMQRQMAFFKNFSLPQKKVEYMSSFEAQHLLTEMQREKIHQGTYQGWIIKETEFFEHSRWLSDNGNFFEKNIKALAEESIVELSQKIGKGVSP
jgi:hypothetical protein